MNTQDEIWKRWQSREIHQRTSEEAVRLAEETWSLGLRLSRHQHMHYQLVMDVVRWDIRT
ncbi:hypothetical protein ACS91J_03290 [Pectobacterium carotovorum]|nr:hypothetical protein PEC301877_19410 [Pectobacterium carotovorum subsp. carotovorum]